MKTSSRTLLLSGILLLAAGGLLVLVISRGSPQAGTGDDPGDRRDGTAQEPGDGKEPAGAPQRPVADRPLAAYQIRLLDLAFQAASAFPLDPHIKNRSRTQERVVTTCFLLDQPRRALAFAEQIRNWRRGAGLADYALYCARHGDRAEAKRYLERARQVAEEHARSENAQKWRSDRIRVKVAQAYLWMGETDRARELSAKAEDSERGRLDITRAERLDESAAEKQIKELDGILASKSFDDLQHGMATCARLFDRFYADSTRRSDLTRRIKKAGSRMPALIRIRSMQALVQTALDHEDPETARALLEEIRVIVDSYRWRPEDRIPVTARQAVLRFRAGAMREARQEIEAALALYRRDRRTIVNIFRAGVLCPVAEAFQAMGDGTRALAIYREAVEEGMVNPNSRPRAEDFAATCCSMARHEVEPDERLWKRLTEICEGLGDPW